MPGEHARCAADHEDRSITLRAASARHHAHATAAAVRGALADPCTSAGGPVEPAAVALAIHETLVNAWQHGHGGRSDLPVRLRLGHTTRAVCLHVLDQGRVSAGAGGAHDPVRAPVFGSRSMPPAAVTDVERGRGQLLIAAGCDEVAVHRHAGGTEVVLRWARTGDGAPSSVVADPHTVPGASNAR